MDFHSDLWVQRLLIGVINTCEPLDLARTSGFVQPLGITGLANLDGDLHENLNEVLVSQPGPDIVTVCTVRRDEADQGDSAILSEQLGNLANAADVLLSVLRSEAQVLVEPMANVVAVQIDCELAQFGKGVLEGARDGAFTAARKPGEPEHTTLLVQESLLVLACNHALVPLDVGGFAHIVGGSLDPAGQPSGGRGSLQGRNGRGGGGQRATERRRLEYVPHEAGGGGK
mmetsp:Transcript_28641/g.80666  ORF Transcript_28641/g.80666 Transcript_28641/m.80666 type:complete len:229 (-) Transcript_28641:136-822(-)